jgi:hypothetical protein
LIPYATAGAKPHSRTDWNLGAVNGGGLPGLSQVPEFIDLPSKEPAMQLHDGLKSAAFAAASMPIQAD